MEHSQKAAKKNGFSGGSSGLLMISVHVLPSRDVVMRQSCWKGTLWHVVARCGTLFTDGSRHVEPTLYIGHVCDLYTTLHLNKRERERKKGKTQTQREREGEIYRVYQIVLRL